MELLINPEHLVEIAQRIRPIGGAYIPKFRKICRFGVSHPIAARMG